MDEDKRNQLIMTSEAAAPRRGEHPATGERALDAPLVPIGAELQRGDPGWWGTEESREETKKTTAEHLAAGRPDGELWYHEWRRNLGHGCYVADVDQIEWRDAPDSSPMKGQPLPAAVVELTVPKEGGYPGPSWRPHPKYLVAILDRYGRDGVHGMGYRLAYLAGQLGVPGYILLHDRERPPGRLWRYQWSAPAGASAPSKLWVLLDLEQHRQWLLALRPAKIWKRAR